LEEAATNQYTLLNMFYDGGGFMYPLVLCSLFGLGVIIAKLYTLWAARRSSATILTQVKELIEQRRLDEAVRLAEATPGPVAAILAVGLRRAQNQSYTSGDIEKAIKTTGTIELGFLERGLPVLATVANVAPLLGFLGTVAGMIAAFGAIEIAGQVEASLVAGGIKIALITTAAGLIIAVPVNVSYNFFVTRIDKLIVEMEEGTDRVLNLVWDIGKAGTGELAAAAAAPSAAAAPKLPGTVEGMGTQEPRTKRAPGSDA
jgi:biopolymer transport protein ExbB